ncbi:MAG: carbohydrate ABC transporter permease [bacterium]|nr:carbohydrate ABC transporter permease [bacterium]
MQKIKKSKSDYIMDTICITALVILFIITFYPFWYVFIASINDPMDTMRGGLTLFPRELNLSAYGIILKDKEFISSMGISVLRVIIGTPLSVLFTSMLAFVLSKKDLVAYGFWNKLFVFTMYFGGGIIPTYMVYKSLGMIDNFIVYIVPSVISVYYMILIKSYIASIPKELEESALIDGANDLIVFFKIIMPVSTPIIATIALFVAINHWNSFFDSYLYTSKQSLKTLQAVMMNILNQYQTSNMGDAASVAANAAKQRATSSDSIRMTATIVSTVPIIMVYPFVQKYFVSGIMMGAVKG